MKQSGQTLGRLLTLLPRYMTAEEKRELLQRLRSLAIQRVGKRQLSLTVSSSDSAYAAFEQALSAVSRLAQVEMPTWLHEVQAWLQEGETRAMAELIRETERQANLERAACLAANIQLLYGLVAELPFRADVSATFELPIATLSIRVNRPRGAAVSQSAESDDAFLARMTHDVERNKLAEGKQSFHRYVLNTLSPQELARVREMAIREGLELEVFIEKLRVQSIEAEKTIADTIRTANQMKEQGHRGTISSEITSSAGTTKIEIHTDRNASTTIMISAAVVVIIAAIAGLVWFLHNIGVIGH